jgi:hypothetical protein
MAAIFSVKPFFRGYSALITRQMAEIWKIAYFFTGQPVIKKGMNYLVFTGLAFENAQKGAFLKPSEVFLYIKRKFTGQQ